MGDSAAVQNPKGFESYRFLNPFRPLYERMGVNYEQMIQIIRLKGKILGRTEQAQLAQSRKKKKGSLASLQPEKERGLFSMGKAFSYLFTSAFIMLYGFIFESPTTVLSLIFTVCFVMQFLGIITSFPVLILDTKDYTVLATKPISSQTITAAKSTVATLYMILTSGTIYSFTFIPFIVKGQFEVLLPMFVGVVLSNLICVALAYMLYGLVLKFYDGEKLKDILSGFQIVLTVVVMLGYQVIAQLQNIVNASVALQFEWWHLLVIPMWLADFSALLIGPEYLIPGLVSLGLILALIVLHFSVTGRILEQNLSKMLSEGEVKRNSYGRKLAVQTKLAKWLYKSPQDQAFFILGYSVSSNDRKMKQTIYPLYVTMLILPAISILNAWRSSRAPLPELFNESRWLIFSLYFAAMTIGSVVLYTKRTEKPSGAWIYQTLPVASQRRAYKAVALNLTLRYVVLPMIFLTGLFTLIAGPKHLLNLVVIFAFTLLSTFATIKSERVDWPFSYELTYSEGKKGMLIIMNVIAIMVFVGIHAACLYWLPPFGVPVLALLTILADVLLWRSI